jgi:hypothetical protein
VIYVFPAFVNVAVHQHTSRVAVFNAHQMDALFCLENREGDAAPAAFMPPSQQES